MKRAKIRPINIAKIDNKPENFLTGFEIFKNLTGLANLCKYVIIYFKLSFNIFIVI